MKKNSYDLKGKLIDCSGVSEVVFNLLKTVCTGVDNGDMGRFSTLKWVYLGVNDNNTFLLTASEKYLLRYEILKPVDILGEPLMKAIELGFTPVFEGDVVPMWSDVFHFDGIIYGKYPLSVNVKEKTGAIAYRQSDISMAYSVNSLTGETTRSPENDSLPSPDFTELKHLDDSPDWKQREKDAYGDEEDIESLARDLLLASISREPMSSENYKSKIESVWTIAREFYKMREQ